MAEKGAGILKMVWPESGPRPAGHYAPGMISGGQVYVSGQLPMVDGQLAAGGIREQTRAALANVDAVLRAAGTDRGHVVMCRVYIPDIVYWQAANAEYAAFFGTHRPARVMVPSTGLHHGALVEIEAVAELA